MYFNFDSKNDKLQVFTIQQLFIHNTLSLKTPLIFDFCFFTPL